MAPERALTLESPDTQAITARLAGAGSLFRELERLLAAAPLSADAEDYRTLLIDENAAGKSSANGRMWMWKRLKLRYALDTPGSQEFRAFRWAMNKAATPAERGLMGALMMARTDRLFREIVLDLVSPLVGRRGLVIDVVAVRSQVENKMAEAGLSWSNESIVSVANHLLSSLRDFGIVEGSRERRTMGVRTSPAVTTFAAMLSRAQGLTDRQVLDSDWFKLLGLNGHEAAAALHAASNVGVLTFRMQADVVELRLPDLDGEAA